MYVGNIVNCYTQAAATVLLNRLSFQNLIHFEIATSVPFGTIYHANDPNRLLDCYIDPDMGIDRAFRFFHIPFEVRYWPKGENSAEAWEVIDDWLRQSPLLLGPINMGKLTYMPQYELYSGIDHYVIVVKKGKKGYFICDPEGIPFISISQKDLNAACITGELAEGRGSYTIRRILKKVDVLKLPAEDLPLILSTALDNLYQASLKPNGGIHGLRGFADDLQAIFSNPSLLRGLRHILNVRMQRCLIIAYYLKLLMEGQADHVLKKRTTDVIWLQENQQQLYGQLLKAALIQGEDPVANLVKTVHELAEIEAETEETMKVISSSYH